jgi:hypothetical protein
MSEGITLLLVRRQLLPLQNDQIAFELGLKAKK